jgi:hypothetical protein
MEELAEKRIGKKGVILKDFLERRDANLIVKETIKEAPIKKYKKKKKKEIKQSETSEKQEVNLFKFIDASRIVEKDKLLSFIKWFGIPKEVKTLKTQSEFATAFGLSIDTLTNWKKLTGFYNEVEIYHLNEMKRFMSDIGMAIVKSAKKGNPRSAELFLKYYMNWNEKIRVEDETPERIITNEEKAKIDHALKNIGLATIIKNNR